MSGQSLSLTEHAVWSVNRQDVKVRAFEQVIYEINLDFRMFFRLFTVIKCQPLLKCVSEYKPAVQMTGYV